MSHKFVVLDNPSHLTPVATPGVLTVAGSDPSGGAGIEADLKTITSYGCYGLTCIDVLTVQNTFGVSGKLETAATVVQGILEADFAHGGINCVKIGVITRPVLTALVPFLETFRPQLVVDTVISSTSGFTLAKQALVRDCITQLYRYATVITPNWDEARIIYSLLFPDSNVGEPSIAGCEDLARELANAIGCRAVLVKGGHVPAQRAITDVLYDRARDEVVHYKHPKIVNAKNTHGTGCTLSSAIASGLACGLDLHTSVEKAIVYVHNAIRLADSTIGAGNGPLNHVYRMPSC